MADSQARSAGTAEFTGAAINPGKPKRALTAARKEQNRIAQKAYRQRQRELREKLRASALQQRSGGIRKLPVLRPQEQKAVSLASFHHVANSRFLGYDSSQEAGPVVQIPSSRRIEALHESSIPASPMVSYQSRDSSQSPALTSVHTSSMRHVSPMRYELALSTAGRLSIDSSPSSSTVTLSDDEGCSRDTVTTRSSRPGSQHLNMDSTAPHIIRASLKLAPHRVFAAVLENALALGFNLDQLIACTGDYLSPFYQPNATPQSDPSHLLASCNTFVKSNNGGNSIPVHLRPTLAQVLVPHHASLDLIPLPFFRERAIMLSVSMPEAFNIWELKNDIYHGDGLMYWQTAKSEKDGKSSGTNFQPWDMKSWEAAPWFLRKWCMIFGGREHSFWKQSMWWNSMRLDEDASRVTS
ncbi:hypothetical protein BGZ63DRAFT_468280 [Mariannaea sp. PMI_226]|nr:hypothetical protein BGZ63DRAFT_468280 [Mariannaea sp. PMI_226]